MNFWTHHWRLGVIFMVSVLRQLYGWVINGGGGCGLLAGEWRLLAPVGWFGPTKLSAAAWHCSMFTSWSGELSQCLYSGGFRLGPEGHRPPKSCPGPPQIFDWLKGCTGGIYRRTRVYAIYQPLVFLTAYNYIIICHNKTGYTGIYALTVNKRMCTAPCHIKLLNFFPCTFCLTCNAYSWEALLACNLISIKPSYNTIKDKNQKQLI